jgi:hypothetical protein
VNFVRRIPHYVSPQLGGITMRNRIVSLVAVCALATAVGPVPVWATTWGQEEVNDPIVKDAKCTVGSPASYGAYIYSWPSKYDQIFWPATEESGIWFCPESGFTALLGDFDGIDDARRTSIAAYLATAYTRDETVSHRKKLELLEGCYALRAASTDQNLRVLRALAYQYEELSDQAAADSRRRSALALILAALDTELKPAQRLEYLFVAAAYQREFGQTKASDANLRQLRSLLKKSRDGDLANYVRYLRELMADIPRIEPGGKLAPEKS